MMAVSIAALLVFVSIVVAAVYFVPSLTVGRLRSAGRSTWWTLLLFVPYANVLLPIVLLFLPERRVDLEQPHTAPDGAASGDRATDDAKISAMAPLQQMRPAESMATPELTQPETAVKATKSKRIWVAAGSITTFLIVLAVARGGGQLLGQFIRSGADGVNSSNRVQSILSDKQPKDYVSSDQGFRVVFPGFPSIDRETLAVQGYNVPTVTYSASVDPNRDTRFVYVWDYSSVPGAAASIDIEGGLNGMVQNIKGAHLVASNASTLGGLGALEGYFTTPLEGQNFDSYARIAHQGAKMYGVMSIGLSKSEFDDFAGSFQLIQ